MNLAREPRWGRNIEVPGEDPYLSGEYATQFVQGFEHAPEDPNGFLQASACCKHYVANEMESTTQLDGESWDRQHYDAAVTQRDLVDSRVGRAGSHDASRRHAVGDASRRRRGRDVLSCGAATAPSQVHGPVPGVRREGPRLGAHVLVATGADKQSGPRRARIFRGDESR